MMDSPLFTPILPHDLWVPEEDLLLSGKPRSTGNRIANAARHFLEVLNAETHATIMTHGSTSSFGMKSHLMRSHLNGRAKALAHILRWVDGAVRYQIQKLQQRRNINSSIHQLPIELLAEIFHLVISADSRPSVARYHLARVSTSWSAIVEASPHLWRFISPADPLHLITRSLATSGECPLVVYAPEDVPLNIPMNEFLRLITPYTKRWESAQIHLTHTEDLVTLRRLGLAAAPLLTTFHLTQPVEKDFDDISMNVFEGRADNLLNLKLSSIIIPWDSPMLSGLRTLSLVEISPLAGPSAHQILEYLMASPQLETLELRTLGISFITAGVEEDDDDNANTQLIHMDHLQSLYLERCSRYILTGIASRVRAPVLRKLQLFQSPYHDGPAWTLDSLKEKISQSTPLIDFVVQYSENGSRLTFTKDNQIIFLDAADDDSEFSIRVPIWAHEDLWSWIKFA